MNIVNLSKLLGMYGIYISSYKSTFLASEQSDKYQVVKSKLKINEILTPLADQRLEEHIAILQTLDDIKTVENPTIKDAYDQLMIAVALATK